jgi:hypothetical protein
MALKIASELRQYAGGRTHAYAQNQTLVSSCYREK